jgi:hypothetical protein
MPDQFPTPRLLTLKEAAEYLGRTTYAMRGLVWSRKIQAVVNDPKSDRRQKLWFDIEDLNTFVETHKI